MLALVIRTIFLYAGPLWIRALDIKKAVELIGRLQKKLAIVVTCVYRTVSSNTILVFNTAYGRWTSRVFPYIEKMAKESRLSSGQIFVESHNVEVLFGEKMQLESGNIYGIVVDKKRGRDMYVQELCDAVFKLTTRLKDNAVFCSDEGEMDIKVKTLEYCARRLNRKFSLIRTRK